MLVKVAALESRYSQFRERYGSLRPGRERIVTGVRIKPKAGHPGFAVTAQRITA